ncbi:reverse transcriptase domain-containing protein [Tanacetum coccineum]
MLFPFSVEGQARIWLDKQPPRSILTWDDLVSKFINEFFPPSKTTNLRNEITRFEQRFEESFSDAWDQFKELLRACPHHGFSELHQLDTFYNALNENDQDSLNSAAGGNFLDKRPTDCLRIIESKSKVRYSRNKAVCSKVNTTSSTPGISPDVAELKNMVKALLIDKEKSQTPAQVKAVEETCVTCGGNHSYRFCPNTRDNLQGYMTQAAAVAYNQGSSSNFRPQPVANHTHPPGFSSNQSKPSNQGNIPHQGMVPYQSPPQNSQVVLASQLDTFKKTTEGSMQVMRNHITNLKAEIRSEVQATLQNQINSLKGEFKNELKSQHNLFMNQQNDFQNNLQNMLSGFFQNQSQPSTSTSVAPTTLPSNTITNPRCEARAITTRSGLSYTPVPPIPPPLYDENEPLTEKETEVTKDKVLPSTKDIQPPVIQKSHDPVKPVSSPISPEPSSAQVNNSPPSKEPSKSISSKDESSKTKGEK